MVKISINGKKIEREFPNMAHALAFAYQRGECYAAEKIEFVKTDEKQGAKKPEQKQTETVPAVDNPDQAGSSAAPEAPQESAGNQTPAASDESKEAAVDNPDQAV